MDDLTRFGAIMTGVAELYGKPLSSAAMTIWWNSLKRFSIEQIDYAINLHVQDPVAGQFMPKPADIIRHLEGNPSERSVGAWAKVYNAIGRVGPYQTICFDDPLINSVIQDMGGWVLLCNVMNDEVPFKAREFERRYAEKIHNPPSQYPASLPGIVAIENVKRNGKPALPVMFGNPVLAEKVYEGGQANQPANVMRQVEDLMQKLTVSR